MKSKNFNFLFIALLSLFIQCKKASTEQGNASSGNAGGPGGGNPAAQSSGNKAGSGGQNNPSQTGGNTPGGQGGPAGQGGRGPGGPPPTYTSITAKGRVINRIITSPGSILAEETTNLQPEVSGRITGIYFKEGSIVHKGALLAKLYDEDLKAQRSKLEVQLKIAEASEKRQKELLAVNGTSQQEYDLATLQVSNIKADMELNAVNLSRTEIRAPYSGKIGLRNVSPGAYVTPQQIIASIAQINTLKIQFNVLEKYAGELKIGKLVNFKTESSDQMYQAKITAFENTLTEDTRQLRMRAQIGRAHV